MTNLKRRACVVAGMAAMAGLAAPAAQAQVIGSGRPIRLVVPFAAGSSTDFVARVVAQHLSIRMGQPFVVDNKGGAGGDIGVDYVVKSAPDGATLLLHSNSLLTSMALGKKLPYDPFKDLVPIGAVAGTPFIVVVPKASEVNNLAELIALARSKPGGLSYGTGGTGTITHLGTELFASAAKIQLLHVPYKGVGQAYPDLLGGRLQVMVTTVTGALPLINGGQVKGLAITSDTRSPLARDLPTASEAGLPGFKLEGWWGIFGPGKLPAPMVAKFNQELNAVLELPEVRDALGREGAIRQPGTPDALGQRMRSELNTWTNLIKATGIRLE